MQANALQQFGPVFAEVKSRFDERPSVRDGLICKQGFYMNSFVLKLQKAMWMNDRMDQIRNESGIFFSVWVNEGSASKNQATITSMHSNSGISKAIQSPVESLLKISGGGSYHSKIFGRTWV